MEKQFVKGEIIFRQGEEGRSFFQIKSGAVEIIVNYGEEDELKLTELKDGKFFGEMAVIESYPRSATAIAAEDGTVLLEIPNEEVAEYLGEHPENILGLMKNLGGRLRELTKDYDDVSNLIHFLHLNEQERESESFLEKVRKHIFFYKSNRKDPYAVSAETKRILDSEKKLDGFAKKVVNYPKGTLICKEGETGDCMYGLQWGTVGVYTGYGTDAEQKLADLYANSFFGELGMIEDEPRSATVVVTSDEATIEIIYPDDLEELFEKNPPKVMMILSHVSSRLRKLTDKYLGACGLVYEALAEAENNQSMSEALKEKTAAYKANLYE